MKDFDVKIHIPDTLFNVAEFDDAMDMVLHKIAWEAEDYWRTIAGQRLKSSRKTYQDAIKTTGTSTRGTIALELAGPSWIIGLEQGTSGYTMKVGRGQIVPLNVNRQIIFTSPSVWSTGTGEPWKHPGFPGFNMIDDVRDEIRDNIAPRVIGEALEKL